MKIGVLALQGDFKDHIKILNKLNVDAVEVRLPEDLSKADGLIIPGGESTTIGKLLLSSGLMAAIIKRCKKGMPIYGTCAGAILLAKKIEGNSQPSLRLLDISVRRNDYGRQIDSFETELNLKNIGKVHGIFIRAPIISKVGKDVEVLGKEKNNPVLVQQDNLLASTFHPELAGDKRVHEYFVRMIKGKQ
ncbi:MAG: pyridoxal 5'-phosphate synthase glutaminase subunit PdxT [Nanoarchaeota archaeon]